MSKDNCGFPDGVVHAHVEVCHEAGVNEGRELERAEIVAWLRDQAAVHRDEGCDARRRGALNHAADRIRDRRTTGRPEEILGVPRA